LQVLDQPVRPVTSTGQTAQAAEDTNLAAKDDSIIKAED
jgi:hypothetical protein